MESKENLPNPPKTKPDETNNAIDQEYRAKVFTNDITVITAFKSDHQNALQDIDPVCRD